MTEKLKTLLHEQASTPDFAPVDLAAITATGDQRVRRRRGAGVVAGVAGLTVVSAAVAVGLGSADSPQVAEDPFPTGVLTWAHGSRLHTSAEQADVGHEIAAYVSTANGYVLTDGEGAVFSYVDGQTERVGTVASRQARLVADADGSLAGWVDPSGDAPVFVVLDTDTGDVITLDTAMTSDMGALADEEDPAYFYAIDGRTAYLRDQRGAIGLDVDDGGVVWKDETARNGFSLVAAENGIVARDAGDRGMLLEGPESEVLLRQVYASLGAFSPSGQWLTLDADEPEVFDAHNGRRVPVDIEDRVFGTGYAWLDDQTLVLIAARTENGPVELLTCAIPSGTCAQAEEFGDFDDFTRDYVLPFGEEYED
jgi:hypothetical protein